MKFHCPLNWELQDRDGKACLIKRTLPFQAWTEWLNVPARGCGKWRVSALQKCHREDTVNAMALDSNNSTTLQSNVSPMEDKRWSESTADPPLSGRIYCLAALAVRAHALVYIVNMYRYAILCEIASALPSLISIQQHESPAVALKHQPWHVLPLEAHWHPPEHLWATRAVSVSSTSSHKESAELSPVQFSFC